MNGRTEFTFSPATKAVTSVSSKGGGVWKPPRRCAGADQDERQGTFPDARGPQDIPLVAVTTCMSPSHDPLPHPPPNPNSPTCFVIFVYVHVYVSVSHQTTPRPHGVYATAAHLWTQNCTNSARNSTRNPASDALPSSLCGPRTFASRSSATSADGAPRTRAASGPRARPSRPSSTRPTPSRPTTPHTSARCP